jgi:hypothetical protein
MRREPSAGANQRQSPKPGVAGSSPAAPVFPRPLRFPLGGAAFGRASRRAPVSRGRHVGRGGVTKVGPSTDRSRVKTRCVASVLVFLTVALTAACGGESPTPEASSGDQQRVSVHVTSNWAGAAPDRTAPDPRVARAIERITGLRVQRADCYVRLDGLSKGLARSLGHPGAQICHIVFIRPWRLDVWWIERQRGRIADLDSALLQAEITNSW